MKQTVLAAVSQGINDTTIITLGAIGGQFMLLLNNKPFAFQEGENPSIIIKGPADIEISTVPVVDRLA